MSENVNNDLLNIDLAKQIIPSPYESKPVGNDIMVKFGMDNLYPSFLLNLYHQCPIHHSIIDTKAAYIIGDGLKIKGGGDLNFKPNVSESLDEFIDKIVKDYLIHNSFAIEVQYNNLTFKDKPLAFFHTPVHSLRTNREKDMFWYSEDWKTRRKEFIYDRWNPNNQDAKSKIFWCDGYIPSINRVYMEPDYTACIESIVTDMSIRNFNRNNIVGNFSPSKVITYYVGENVSAVTQDRIKTQLDKYFSGSGEKYMVVFANPNQEKMKVENIDSNTWDRAYEVTRASVKDEIYEGHSISASLLGKETAGKLGNVQELEMNYEIFKANYVQNKRNQITSALSQLFGVEVEFVDRPLFKGRIPEATKEKVYTINELRAIDNLPPLPDGDRLLTPQPTQQVVQPNTSIQAKMEKQEFKLTAEDYEKVKDMGIPKLNFEYLCDGDEETLSKVEIKLDNQSDIADYVISNDIKGLTINQLKILVRKDLGINITGSELDSILSDLDSSGMIKYTKKDGVIDIKPPTQPSMKPGKQVQVMYQYDVKPGLGQPLIPTSRDFCVKLVEDNRYYTRTEIQTMSQIFGYDIFTYTGGYYYNPETNTTTPSCRHKWTSVVVSPK